MCIHDLIEYLDEKEKEDAEKMYEEFSREYEKWLDSLGGHNG